MRILLTTAPLYGHVLPLVPLSWALRAAGHEVLLAAPGEFAGVAGEAGLPAVASAGAVSMGGMIGFERDGTPAARPADPQGRVRQRARLRSAGRTRPGADAAGRRAVAPGPGGQ
ncbi:glycosyltransferase [Kitasatospora aburaviensis]